MGTMNSSAAFMRGLFDWSLIEMDAIGCRYCSVLGVGVSFVHMV